MNEPTERTGLTVQKVRSWSTASHVIMPCRITNQLRPFGRTCSLYY